MFCSAVWHCLILADTKRENTYHLRLMYRARGKGCQNGEEGGGPSDKAWDGLMTVEADGERHLPWRRSQSLYPDASEGRTQRWKEGNRRRGEKKREKKRVCVWMCVCFSRCINEFVLCEWLHVKFCFKVTLFLAQACVGGLLAALWLASRWPRFVELGLGLGFRTLFGGNGGVNTKGLVQRVASLTVSLYVCMVGGGGGLKLMDGLRKKTKQTFCFNNAKTQ